MLSEWIEKLPWLGVILMVAGLISAGPSGSAFWQDLTAIGWSRTQGEIVNTRIDEVKVTTIDRSRYWWNTVPEPIPSMSLASGLPTG